MCVLSRVRVMVFNAIFNNISVISWRSVPLSIRFDNKRNCFDFAIINFPHLDSDMLTAPRYGVHISLTAPAYGVHISLTNPAYGVHISLTAPAYGVHISLTTPANGVLSSLPPPRMEFIFHLPPLRMEFIFHLPPPRMEFIFHNSYATLELPFYIQTFYNVIVFWLLIKLLNKGFLKNRLILSFKLVFFFFPKYINTLLKSILSVTYR